MSKRVLHFDGLRGLAILSVILWHYLYVYELKGMRSYTLPSLINDKINLGQFGVGLFFLLSGYLICTSIASARTRKEFLIKRIARISVPYWCGILVIATILSIFTNKEYSAPQLLVNALFLQDILPFEHVDGVFWTLVIEVKFYLLVGFIGYNLLKVNSGKVILILSCLSLLAAISTGFNLGLYYKLWSSMTLLFVGVHLKLKSKLDSTVIISIALIAISFFFLPENKYGDKLGYSVATVLALFVFMFREKMRLLNSGFLCSLGGISYSLYLYHQELGYFILDKINSYDLEGISFFITFFLMYLIAFVSYHLIEKKMSFKTKEYLLRKFRCPA